MTRQEYSLTSGPTLGRPPAKPVMPWAMPVARGLHHVAHSCAARAGVMAFSEAVAVEWAPLGIRVNCVAPGAIQSEGWKVYSEEVSQRYHNTNPMRKVGQPWDVAEACLYLAGPSGRFITGDTLQVTGWGHLWGETWTTEKPVHFVEASRAYDPVASKPSEPICSEP